jgi:type I restriction enzyme, S subunit
VKAGWESTILGNVIDLQSGFAFKSAEFTEEGHFLMRIANVQNGHISLEKPKFVKLTEQTKRFELKKGDILTSLTGNVGRVAEIKASHLPAALNQRVARIKPKEDFDVDRSYLLHFLSSDAFSSFLEQEAHGAAQANVSPNAIKEVPFALPPLEEQKRIVSILDEAFEGLDRARENAEANLKNARELFDSYRDSLLNGSSLATLEDYLDNITYGFTNPMPDSDEGPYKITAKNVINRAINYQTARKTTQEAFDNLLSAKSKPAVGDVLLTKDGTLGRTAVVDRDGICINQSVAVLKPRDGLLPQYLNEILNTRTNQAAMIGDAGGATIKHLYITRIPKINVFVPTIEEQQRLLNELGNFNIKGTHCEMHYTTKVQDISDLRQSLLQKAFAGELT